MTAKWEVRTLGEDSSKVRVGDDTFAIAILLARKHLVTEHLKSQNGKRFSLWPLAEPPGNPFAMALVPLA
ncbi:MAG TPA: hypothetical protein VFC37_04785 [Terracidiphilus sp.]|nr:hypothetical protein [Terracidiphilus sp.]